MTAPRLLIGGGVMLTRSQALGRLERGDVLRMELADGARRWWFEAPYAEVSDQVVRSLTDGRADGPAPVSLVEAGDSLFGLRGQSQSWLAVRGEG